MNFNAGMEISHDQQGRPAVNEASMYGPPEAAVQTVIAVVSRYEIMLVREDLRSEKVFAVRQALWRI